MKTVGFYPRPFTVPLVYKLAKSDPDRIIQIQKFFHAVSTFSLVFSLMLFIKKDYVKYLMMFFIYALMSWWNILGWTISLLSESLSISFLFLWLSSFLVLVKRKTVVLLILHIVITILFSFTRDSWPYILILFYSLGLISSWFFDKPMLKKNIMLLLISFLILCVQNYSIEVGHRQRLPVLNNVVIKILPNESYLQWFAGHGMPCIDKLKKEYSGLTYNDKRIYTIYKDTTYTELFNWIDKEGKQVYIKFLITHPFNSLLFNEKSSQADKIFAYDLITYTGEAKVYSWTSYSLFPLFNIDLILFFDIILICFFIKKKKYILLYPTVLIFIFTFNTLLMFNADALEMERHLFLTNIMVQFIGVISVAFILDNIDFTGDKSPKKDETLKDNTAEIDPR